MSTCKYCNGVVSEGGNRHLNMARCVTRLRMLLRDVRRDAKAGRLAIETEAEIDEVLAGESPS